MIPSIYINLEEDVSRVLARVKREHSPAVVIVCPKRCFLFNDSINLRLLKKQTDLLNKEVYILTMDERGQAYAKEAGFGLKFLPKTSQSPVFSDIRRPESPPAIQTKQSLEPESPPAGAIIDAVKSLTGLTKFLSKAPKIRQAQAIINEQAETKPKEPANARAMPAWGPANGFPAKVSAGDIEFPVEIEQGEKLKKKRKINQRFVTALVAGSLLLILAVVFVILPKATVLIYAKTEPVTRDMEINISINFQKPDSSRLILPATKISEPVGAESDFQSQGKLEVGNKSAGTVSIYNFTKLPINLKSATTVLTVGSKNYKLAQDAVQIKPTVYKNARTKEVNENSLSDPVDVIAAEGGDEFNLPDGTRMEITNQVFGSKPQVLYAKTHGEINGGTSRYLSVISQTDVTGSQQTLTDTAVNALRNKLSVNGLILLDRAYAVNAPQYSSDKPAGTQSPAFHSGLQAKIDGLTFKKQDLQQLVLDRINSTLSQDKSLTYNKDNAFNYKIKDVDLNNGLATLLLHFEGQASYKVDLSNIKSELTGKTENQVSEILKSKPEIDHIDLTLAPVWQKTFPFFTKKIDVSMGQTVY